MILDVWCLGEWWQWLGWDAPLEVGCERDTLKHWISWAAFVGSTGVVHGSLHLPYGIVPLVKVHYF